jgi:heptosyltransferase-1
LRILIVKLSSLGDVVHCMPAVQDIRHAWPDAHIDWVVERGFMPLVQRCEGVRHVIPIEERKWRKRPFARETRVEWRAFRNDLATHAYDAIIDLQGLTKSAVIARLAVRAEGGRRFALGNRTDGASWEPPTRWLADRAFRIEPHTHAVQRGRILCAAALGYELPVFVRYGLAARMDTAQAATKTIAFVHGTSRDDKCWPESHWVALARRLVAQGHRIAFPHGNEAERERSERMATVIGPAATVWPRLALDELTDRIAACAGVIGVDSGLSHVAVALGLPHVQIYNFDTAWRTGPIGNPRQASVYAQPTPGIEAVAAAWQQVTMPG